MTTFVPMTSYSRCKRYAGSLIKCPSCEHITHVYHLSWAALTCQKCKKSHFKINWLIEKGKYSKEVNK